ELVGRGVLVVIAADDECALGNRSPGVTPLRRWQEALDRLEDEKRRRRRHQECGMDVLDGTFGEEMIDRPAAERVADEGDASIRRFGRVAAPLCEDFGERRDPRVALRGERLR